MSGHPRTLAAAGAILSVLSLPIGHAQQQDSAIERCAGVADAAARIRCLEDAIRGLSDQAPGAPTGAADAPAATDSDTSPTTGASAAAAPSAGEGRDAPEAAANEAAPAAAAPARSEPAADVSPLDRMGEQQVRRENEADSDGIRVSAQVVQFDFVARNKLRMRLENGQVWRQIDADRGDFYPMLRGEERFEVELWQTGIGGYRMRFLPGNRTLRVRRIQ